ncbi:hypothetical protein F4818DRAFT_453765 [Hypoxylon cercidicola]|nr:hypothetical protein F4818DRAFT_453765 [Hypoxylon cercidicola]
MAPSVADVDVKSNLPVHQVKKSVGAQPIKTAISSRLDHQVSQRGVVFFGNQYINIDDQNSPETRRLLSFSKCGMPVDENGRLDDEVFIISSEQNRKFYKDRFTEFNTNRSNSITFEDIPSDYAILKIIQPPEDAYDRLSPPLQILADSITATHYQPGFVKVQNDFGEELIDQERLDVCDS